MRLLLLSVVAVAALVTGGCDRQSAAPAQGNVADGDAANLLSPDEVPPAAAPAPSGERSADRGHAGRAAPDFAFADLSGKATSLAAFRGRPVLVNLWATWCAPCVKELPTLDALAVREGGRLHVVALSQDMDAAKVAPFVKDKGYRALPVFTDAKMAWMPGITPTLPTTILYDSQGREVWRLTGDYDWSGAEAATLIAEAK